MRLDVTVQRQSKIIIGITVVVVTSFFVAFALAVGALCIQSQGSPMPNVGLGSNDIAEPKTGNEHLVPVASKYCFGPFDTEPGEIELLDYYFPYYNQDTGELLPLPLCITNEMSQTWWFDIKVTGGYTPEETVGFWPELGITIWQDQNKDGFPEMIQGWNIEWTLTNPDDPCCVPRIYHGVPAWCGNVVCLDSNQYPILTGGLEGFVSDLYPDQQDKIPGKEVYINVGLLFSGCPLDEQQFAYV
ncbi:unnamed protein product, partial [marine sediment metagenome]